MASLKIIVLCLKIYQTCSIITPYVKWCVKILNKWLNLSFIIGLTYYQNKDHVFKSYFSY
jgi:hypothetical protein